jgi:hypothetical protein
MCLGEMRPVTPEMIERLFASDFAYLQELYVKLNDGESHLVETECPTCGTRFELDLMADEDG